MTHTTNTYNGDRFGSQVKMSKNGLTMLVLAPETGRGRLYVFHRTTRDSNWDMEEYWDHPDLTYSSSSSGYYPVGDGGTYIPHQFAISHDGSTIAFADATPPTTGTSITDRLRVFTRASNGTWSQRGNTLNNTGVAKSQTDDNINGDYEDIHAKDNITLNADGTVMAVGVDQNYLSSTYSYGYVRSWDYNSGTNTWDSRTSHADMSGSSDWEYVGRTVILDGSGDVLLVTGGGTSATINGHFTYGRVRIYKWGGSSWSIRDTISAQDVHNDTSNGQRTIIGTPMMVDMSEDGYNVAIGSVGSLSSSSTDYGSVAVYEYWTRWRTAPNQGGYTPGYECVAHHVSNSSSEWISGVYIGTWTESRSQSVVVVYRPSVTGNSAGSCKIKRFDCGLRGQVDEYTSYNLFNRELEEVTTHTITETGVNYMYQYGTYSVFASMGVDRTLSDIILPKPGSIFLNQSKVGSTTAVGKVQLRDFQGMETQSYTTIDAHVDSSFTWNNHATFWPGADKNTLVECSLGLSVPNSNTDDDRGYFKVLTRDPTTNTWSQKGNTVYGSGQQKLGMKAHISDNGNVVTIQSQNSAGASTNDFAGRINRYEYNSSTNTWTYTGGLSDPHGQGFFGLTSRTHWAASDDGGMIVIGYSNAQTGSSHSGRVGVWQWQSSTSSYQARGSVLNSSSISWTNYFYNLGTSVAISGDGDTIAAHWIDNSTSPDAAGKGYVQVLQWQQSTSSWVVKDSVGVNSPTGGTADHGASHEYNSELVHSPGVYLSYDGSILAASSPRNDPTFWSANVNTHQVRQGGVWVYEYNTTSSTYAAKGSMLANTYRLDAGVLNSSGQNQYYAPTYHQCAGISSDGMRVLVEFSGLSNFINAYKGEPSGGSEFREAIDNTFIQVFEWDTNTSDWIAVPEPFNNPADLYSYTNGYGMSRDGYMMCLAANPWNAGGGGYTNRIQVYISQAG